MQPWLELSVPEFLAASPEEVAARLAHAQAARHAMLELTQRTAWEDLARGLQAALAAPACAGWTVMLEYDLLRLHKRLDAVVLTDRAVIAIEWKNHARGVARADLRQVEDYALDLHDFHAGCRAHPVVPLLVATDAPPTPFAAPLLWQGVLPPMACNAAELGARLAAIEAAIGPPAVPLDARAWRAAPYRPVPSVLEAAQMLFDRHRSAEMTSARADAANLTRTTEAVARAIARAEAEQARIAVFVTGIPGAGKTLCGLNIVFGALRGHGAAFLTGNAPLVAVLREDLRRRGGGGRDHARTALQNVHRFLEHHVTRPTEVPEARIIVFDEAQRAWDAAQATRDTQRRVSRLTMSEPAHTLEIMARHPGWSVIVALIGNGQEINTGEAGLAEWGRAIAAQGGWRALAAPRALEAAEPAQRLAEGHPPWLDIDPALDLAVPMRSVRAPLGAAWVDAVLRGDAPAARAIAAEGALPYLLTRDLGALRAGLRRLARGERRAGLVASSGAKRLRAEGLGVQTGAVERWFLDRWPDVRASDALETFATEYDCQGLELDVVGLAWGGDLRRGTAGWEPRAFVGTRWQAVRKAEDRAFVVNSYRVLLTRARYETLIWVPLGSPEEDPFHDATRPAREMDAIAAFLLDCGVRPLALSDEGGARTLL
ncbi:DNA/RNA helicase domain-containing protein [Rubritepida flocculans]|uniref:DNA/RNA helicase domain-containing protein n=1 Tax=Rubritepida flocculans TaxID=182403 RepID=UPI000402D126|nr:DNA/RNA helicase domain-containing protein [Rubritepida flocculans]